jgi:anti-sigma regulatory factor (Ser/Thr protein kinase)
MDGFSAHVLATPDAISAIMDDVFAFLETEKVDDRAAHHVVLILEEVLTNLGTHGDCADHPAEVSIHVLPHEVSARVSDRGTPFDLTQAPDPALDMSTEHRPIGGLGLFLVRKLSSRVEYHRRGDRNRLEFAVARATAQAEDGEA